MFVLCLEWPPLAPSHCTSIGRSGRVKLVYIFFYDLFALGEDLEQKPSTESHHDVHFFPTQHITPDAHDSTLGQVIVRGVPDSVTKRPEQWFNVVTNVFSVATIWTAKGKKKWLPWGFTSFLESTKKNQGSRWHFFCPASINFIFWNVILFFGILTCPKAIRWCSAWKHDLNDLTPLKSKVFPRHLNGHHRALSTNFFIPVIGCGVKQWWKWVLDIWK